MPRSEISRSSDNISNSNQNSGIQTLLDAAIYLGDLPPSPTSQPETHRTFTSTLYSSADGLSSSRSQHPEHSSPSSNPSPDSSSLRSPGNTSYPFDARGIRGHQEDGTEQNKSWRQFAREEGTYTNFSMPQQTERLQNETVSFVNASKLRTGRQDSSKGWTREGPALNPMTRHEITSRGGEKLHADPERSKRITKAWLDGARHAQQERSYKPSEDRERYDDRY